jgi:hypothetical protein
MRNDQVREAEPYFDFDNLVFILCQESGFSLVLVVFEKEGGVERKVDTASVS